MSRSPASPPPKRRVPSEGQPLQGRSNDHERQAIRQLDIVEVTAADFKYGLVALPYTFSLAPDLTIHAIYDGWWFVGRPTLEELRQDMRALMQACRQDYHYNGPSLASVERA